MGLAYQFCSSNDFLARGTTIGAALHSDRPGPCCWRWRMAQYGQAAASVGQSAAFRPRGFSSIFTAYLACWALFVYLLLSCRSVDQC